VDDFDPEHPRVSATHEAEPQKRPKPQARNGILGAASSKLLNWSLSSGGNPLRDLRPRQGIP